MVETGRVTAPLGPDASVDNRIFMREYVMQLLIKSFPNLTPKDVHAFVVGLFEKNDFDSFCNHLRDFLVQLKEFSDGDSNKVHTALFFTLYVLTLIFDCFNLLISNCLRTCTLLKRKLIVPRLGKENWLFLAWLELTIHVEKLKTCNRRS